MVSTLKKKLCVLLVFCGLLQIGSCLSRDLLLDGVRHAGLEFLLDNDAVFDLFAD